MVQMGMMALCFSYMANWIVSRFCFSARLQAITLALLAVYFGASSEIASYAVAMWKDPIFSISILIFTIVLINLALFGAAGRARFARKRVAWFAFFALNIVFFRNDGVYILAFMVVLLAVWLYFDRKNVMETSLGFDSREGLLLIVAERDSCL